MPSIGISIGAGRHIFAGPAPAAPLLTWASAETDASPDFDIDLPSGFGAPLDAEEDDVLVIQYSTNGTDWTEYLSHTLTAGDLVDDEIELTADELANDEYEFRARLERGAAASDWSASEAVTIEADVTAPSISVLSPADNAADVAIAATLVATFDEAIAFGATVDIALYKFDDTLVEAWDETDIGAGISISGSALTINPAASLDNSQAYYVQITSGSIEDVIGNAFGGITNETTWSFTSVSEATTVIDTTMDADDNGWGGYTMVTRLSAANLAAATGQYIRVTLSFAFIQTGVVISAYVGQKAAAGDAYDANALVQLTFNSGNITGDGSGAIEYVSDWILLNEAYDETKDYLVSMQFGAGTVNLRRLNGTGDFGYEKVGSTEAATADKATGTYDVINDRRIVVKKIEITSAPPNVVNVSSGSLHRNLGGAIPSSKVVTIAIGMDLKGGDGTDMQVISTEFGNGYVYLLRNSSNKLVLTILDTGGGAGIVLTSTTSIVAASGYQMHHFWADVNGTPSGGYFLNGVSDLAGGATLDGTNDLQYADSDMYLFNNSAGTRQLNADVFNFYMNFGAAISDPTKFYSGGWVDPAGAGAPHTLLRNAYGTFNSDNGSLGGTWTIVGSLSAGGAP